MRSISPEEIKFGKYRRRLLPLIHVALDTGLGVSGFPHVESGEKWDQNGGLLQGDTLKGQILRPYVSFRNPRSGDIESIEVAIGHSLPDWNPIIIVSSTSTDPVSLPDPSFAKDAEPDPYPLMRPISHEIAARFRCIMEKPRAAKPGEH